MERDTRFDEQDGKLNLVKNIRIPLLFNVPVELAQQMSENEMVCAGVLIQAFKDNLQQMTKALMQGLANSFVQSSLIVPGTKAPCATTQTPAVIPTVTAPAVEEAKVQEEKE